MGSAWTLETVTAPVTSEVTLLNAVSCSARNACTAVGTYLTQDGQLGLAERFNGTTWSPQGVPAPSGEPVESLAGVSCPSASSCIAVGGATSFVTGAAGPVAARWNGSTWTDQPTPPQPGGFLNAVSCSGPASCVAVGTPGTGTSAALARPSRDTIPRPGLLAGAPAPTHHGTWRFAANRPLKRSASMYRRPAGLRQLAARLRSGRRAHRASVSPTSLTLAERWNGTDWTLTPTPAITGAAASQTFGVSCASSSDCFATGSWFDSSGAELPLLEHWDGTSWSIQPVPDPTGVLGARLFDVSCAAANACTAVGEAFTLTSEMAFSEQWDGTSWMLESTPADGRLGTALGSVSCPAAGACTAVGALLNNENGTLKTLAEFWNGSSWTIEPSISQPGNTSSALYGVSCTGSTCMAVGDWNGNTSDSSGPLSELGTGTAWQLEAIPAPQHASFSLTSPVSCTAADACTAVGSWFGLTGAGAFADRWDGTAWTQQSLPESLFELNAVACSTATSCLAVDDGMSARWDGNTWTVQPLAGNFPSLTGIWCSAAGDCTAVGTGGTAQPLPVAERYS